MNLPQKIPGALELFLQGKTRLKNALMACTLNNFLAPHLLVTSNFHGKLSQIYITQIRKCDTIF